MSRYLGAVVLLGMALFFAVANQGGDKRWVLAGIDRFAGADPTAQAAWSTWVLLGLGVAGLAVAWWTGRRAGRVEEAEGS